MTDFKQYIPATFIFILGMILSLSLHSYILKKENTSAEENFKRTALERANTIENHIKNKITILRSVVAFYAGSTHVSNNAFNSFIRKVSLKGEAIQAIEWIPAIPFKKRTEYENILKKEGFPLFDITEKNSLGKKVSAGPRDTYYPVYYVVPYEGNEGAHGFDLGSSKIRLSALHQARDTGKAVTSGLIHLVQLKEKNEGVLVFYPVYNEELSSNTIEQYRQNIQGFVLAVFRLSNLVSGSFAINENIREENINGIDIYLFDQNDNDKNAELLYIHHSRSRKENKAPNINLVQATMGVHVSQTLYVGGKKWTLILKPASKLHSEFFKSTSSLLLIVSILMTLSATFYFLSTVHRRKRIEEEIKQRTSDLNHTVEIANNKEKRIRAIVDNTGEGIVTLSEEGYIFTVNPAFEKLCGYMSSEVVGKQIGILLDDDKDKGVFFNPEDFDEHNTNSKSYELIWSHKNGRILFIDLTLSSVRISNNKTFIGIIHDVSARKETEKMKEGFISTVSHELRTPMTSIKGSLSLIISGTVGVIPDTAKDMLDVAYNNSERLIRLINDILDIDKMASGKMTYDMKELDLIYLLQQSIESNKGYANKYNVNFKLNFGDIKKVNVLADYDRLMQVMTNLLSNSAKFSKAGEDVVVNLIDEGDRLKVSVSDTGEGIPDDFRPTIFERFSQADSSDSKQNYGTGLGLAICKSIIIEHNGSIDYESTVGKGTTFYFYLYKLN